VFFSPDSGLNPSSPTTKFIINLESLELTFADPMEGDEGGES